MGIAKHILAFAATAVLSAAGTACTPFGSQYPDAVTKAVDVVIVGGGSSGSHAAISLVDAGKSVLLIEKQGQLGGMVNSYTDPKTGKVYDYGVAAYTNFTGAEAYFERLGINVTGPTFSRNANTFADFTTGQTVDFISATSADLKGALQTFQNVANQYAEYYIPSYANWPAPADIPEDLLIPFKDFAIKYNLGPMLQTIWSSITSGVADMLSMPTVFFFQTFGPETAGAFLGTTQEFVPASGRNQDIYDKILSILGKAVMLSSTVVDSVRHPGGEGVSLVVQGADGKHTIVNAKRLVLSIEPIPANTAAFHLDSKESGVFSKGVWSDVQTGVINHPSLPVNVTINNMPFAAANGNNYSYPEPPFVDYYSHMGDGVFQAIVIGWENLTVEAAQALAANGIELLAKAGNIPPTNGAKMEILSWSDHGAMDMRVTREQLSAGFIQDLYGLQGYRSTFWTGAAFSCQLSTSLWAYNLEYLVPAVLDSF